MLIRSSLYLADSTGQEGGLHGDLIEWPRIWGLFETSCYDYFQTMNFTIAKLLHVHFETIYLEYFFKWPNSIICYYFSKLDSITYLLPIKSRILDSKGPFHSPYLYPVPFPENFGSWNRVDRPVSGTLDFKICREFFFFYEVPKTGASSNK